MVRLNDRKSLLLARISFVVISSLFHKGSGFQSIEPPALFLQVTVLSII